MCGSFPSAAVYLKVSPEGEGFTPSHRETVKVSPDSAPEAVGVELRLAGGDCVVIRPGFDRQTLIDLLGVLNERAPESRTRETSA